MKKAKITLTAIAVIAVVGVGLAFKSKNFGNAFFTSYYSNASICYPDIGFTMLVDFGLPEVYVGTSSSSCPDYRYFLSDAL